MEMSHCSCGDVIHGSSIPIPKSLKPKSPSIERCMNAEFGQFRPRSNTLPSELKEKLHIKSKPLARIARDPIQPLSGSLTKLNQDEELGEEEDFVAPVMRRRSNTCPEKRALQMVKRKIRNRPPTPPPCDISPTGSFEDGSPRERTSSLTRSFERVSHLPELPEASDQKDCDCEESGQQAPSVFKPLVLDADKVCQKLQNRHSHDINCNLNNLVSVSLTDSVTKFDQHCGKLASCNCRTSSKDVPNPVHSKTRVSLP